MFAFTLLRYIYLFIYNFTMLRTLQ